MKFNINHNVRVKLTDFGRQILREKFDETMEEFPHLTLNYTPPVEDAEGWSRWQLWCLMSELGSHLNMGCKLPFLPEIEIEE